MFSLWNNKKKEIFMKCGGKSVAENKQTQPVKNVLGGGGCMAAPPSTASVLIGGNISLTAPSL